MSRKEMIDECVKEIPECKMCAGKGYYNLSSSYDDIHSRILCECGQYNEDDQEVKDD